MNRRVNMEWISVIILSILASLAASTTYLSFIFHTPPQTINLGVTHYWEDYMYYVSQFTQGAHGAWLNYAMYTEETIAPTLLHWPNILLGKIGGLVHLNPMDSYNISIIMLSCAFLIFTYYSLKKLFPKPAYAFSAFLFFLFSTSIMNRLPDGSPYRFFPYQLWNTPHFMFMRTGILPHYLVTNIFFLLSLVLLFTHHTKNWMNMFIIPVLCILTILQPIAATLLVGTYWLTTIIWKDHRNGKNTLFLTIGYLIGSFYLASLYVTNDYVNGMTGEAQWQVRTTIPFLLKSIGPIVLYAALGILFRLKKAAPIERFGIILLPVAYLSFLLPISERIGISNARLLFPAQYLFWGWFAAVGLYETAEWLKSFVTYKKNIIIGLLFLIFFISASPTIIWELQQKVPDTSIYQNPLYFLPKPIYDAFIYIQKQKPLSSFVLANPSSGLDILVPVVSGHRTITGLRYTTVHLTEKRKEVVQFFTLGMDSTTALHWLQLHKVSFVLFTLYDGDKEVFQQRYPFLTPVYSTPTGAVYQMNR